MSFRKVLFWVHLSAGLVAGAVIAVMSFTGLVLAFEDEIVAWAERDVRRVSSPAADAPRLSIEALTAKFKEAYPDLSFSGITLSADPRDAVTFSAGREGAYYANPYTGEFKTPTTTRTHDFMHVMIDWHRWLAMSGDQRATGKAITGVCNTAFLVLGLTGLYLWWPRKWTAKALKPFFWFTGAKGKARDFNWHNVIGFWCLPVLIVLTATGMVISYRWAGNLVYTLVGEAPPQGGPGGPGGGGRGGFGPQVTVPTPAPGAKPLGQDVLFAAAQQAMPRWESISLRMGGFGRGGGGGGPAPAGAARGPAREGGAPGEAGANREAGPRREGGDGARMAANGSEGGSRREGGGGGAGREGGGGRASSGPSAFTVSVKERGSWPVFVSKTVSLDPFTGVVLKTEGYENYTAGRKARSWLRFLHTGQAFGWPGQFLAAVACLGGLFLVWTGFALSWRRFFGKKRRPGTEKAKTPAPLVSAS